MKILHTPIEISGQLGLTVKGLRTIGLRADSLVYKHPYGYKNDFYFEFFDSQEKRRESRKSKLGFINENYDVIHYSFGTPILHDYEDVKYFLDQNKKICIEFWGTDVRLNELEKKRNKYYVPKDELPDKSKIELMKRWSEYSGGQVIFSDHTFNDYLQPYFDKIHIVGQRVDTKKIVPVFSSESNEKIKVLHAPSHHGFKGTKYVLRAVEQLKNKGYDFEFILVENKTHHEAMEMYKQADIIVDQLCGGAHGVFACEAMALGKPVICNILDEVISGYSEGFPIINANPDNLAEVLAYWIEASPKERYNLGVKSREYAVRNHDIEVVAQKLKKVYEM